MWGKRLSAAAIGAATLGLMLGATAPSNAAVVPLLPTTTTMALAGGFGIGPIVLTATVRLNVVNGLLVTPSGSVAFSKVNPRSEGPEILPLGTATLSSCLLGLPAIAGVTTMNCTARYALTAAQETGAIVIACGAFVGTYSASTDLLAEPSTGQVAYKTQFCGP